MGCGGEGRFRLFKEKQKTRREAQVWLRVQRLLAERFPQQSNGKGFLIQS